MHSFSRFWEHEMMSNHACPLSFLWNSAQYECTVNNPSAFVSTHHHKPLRAAHPPESLNSVNLNRISTLHRYNFWLLTSVRCNLSCSDSSWCSYNNWHHFLPPYYWRQAWNTLYFFENFSSNTHQATVFISRNHEKPGKSTTTHQHSCFVVDILNY